MTALGNSRARRESASRKLLAIEFENGPTNGPSKMQNTICMIIKFQNEGFLRI
jgi:hypothetical protein